MLDLLATYMLFTKLAFPLFTRGKGFYDFGVLMGTVKSALCFMGKCLEKLFICSVRRIK